MSQSVLVAPLPTPPFEGECILWAGAKDRDGYGRIYGQGMAHRVFYERARGRIPEGFHIDHLCQQRACVNVDHLDAVPPRVNVLRSPYTQASINYSKSECINGHPYDHENTINTRAGRRKCRECNRIWSRARTVRKREAKERGDGVPYQKSVNGRPKSVTPNAGVLPLAA